MGSNTELALKDGKNIWALPHLDLFSEFHPNSSQNEPCGWLEPK
jgi:hypothetical protein